MSPSISLQHHHRSLFSVAVEMPPHRRVNHRSTGFTGLPFRPRCNWKTHGKPFQLCRVSK
jgi:hypothetical protein